MCKININQKTKTKELGQSKGKEKIVSAKAMYFANLKSFEYRNEIFYKKTGKRKCGFGYWGEQTLETVAKVQTAKAVQDQFNFGSGAYNADLKLWKMEQNIDIWEQIETNISNLGKYLNNIYNDNRNQQNFGKSIPFKWSQMKANIKNNRMEAIETEMAFGGNPHQNIKTLAWPFGRTTAKCVGSIILDYDNAYFIRGELEFKSDAYSWKADGATLTHNAGIFLFSTCLNYYEPKKGYGYGTWYIAPDVKYGLEIKAGISYPALHPNSTQFDNTYVTEDKYYDYEPIIRWGTPSSAYKNGEMPVNYSRKFYFYLYILKK